MTVWTSTGSARSVDPVRPAGPVVVGVPDAGAEAPKPGSSRRTLAPSSSLTPFTRGRSPPSGCGGGVRDDKD